MVESLESEIHKSVRYFLGIREKVFYFLGAILVGFLGIREKVWAEPSCYIRY